jgi:hypothetical protein
MKYIFIILVLLGLSCQTKTAEQNSTKDSTAVVTSPTPVSSPAPVQEAVPSTYEIGTTGDDFTVLLLAGTPIYSDTTDDSNVLMETKTLTPKQTHITSTWASPAGINICDQYFWYTVATEKGEGWVYGKNVLQVGESAPYSKLEIAGTPYDLYYLVDSGVGPSNKDGLTGCNQFYIPYLWHREKGTLLFIQDNNVSLPDKSLTTSYSGYGWLSLISSEGGSAQIRSIEYNKSESNFHLFLNVGYQDGGSKFHMIVVEREGNMVLQSFNEINEE